MKTILFADGEWGLRSLASWNHQIAPLANIVLSTACDQRIQSCISELAKTHGIAMTAIDDVNSIAFEQRLKEMNPDLFVVAGYQQRLMGDLLEIPNHLSLGLHAGRLPQMRGSDPLQWALLEGQKEFTLTVLRINARLNCGDVLSEQNFAIGPKDTLADLIEMANVAFPEMLHDALYRVSQSIAHGEPLELRQQADDDAAYYPKRLEDDNLIMWDLLTANEIHCRIRALGYPRAGAYSYFNGRKVYFKGAEMSKIRHAGEPGRIYRMREHDVLVGAKDQAVWLLDVEFDNGQKLSEVARRYDSFLNLKELTEKMIRTQAASVTQV